jgi:glutathione S-transferase
MEGEPLHIIETRRAPNPRRVRIFIAEKGIEIDYHELDMMAGDLKSQSFTEVNPWQRVPVLILDDGQALAETVAICRYFEELTPEPSLFGRGTLEKAQIEMWQRRVELGLFQHIAEAFRHLNPKMAHLETPQVAAWGEANVHKVAGDITALDAQLAQNQFIAGDRFSIADITMLVAIDFMKPAKLAVCDDAKHVLRWHSQVSGRPSALA